MATLDNRRVCVILLIGLPACGKTFLTNLFVNYIRSSVGNNETGFVDTCVVPVTYDEYIKYKELDELNGWKSERKIIFSYVEELVSCFKNNNRLFNNCLQNKYFCCDLQFIDKNDLLIIIDDNMYYRSMRYEYFQLAKKYEISFCQIYLEATLEDALQFNRKRLNVVPDEVIRKMAEKIERPNPGVNNWERNSITFPAYCKFDDSFVLVKLNDVIKTALLTPEKCKNLSLNAEECKIITDTNLLHQIDIGFRSCINGRIREYKKDLNKESSVKCFAEELNNRRLQLLKNIKSGSLMLPCELVNVLQCANRSTVDEEFIRNSLVNIFDCNY